MRFQHSFAILLAILARARASVVPPSAASDEQCSGLSIDFTRLQNVQQSDINPITRSLGGRDYGVNTIVPVTDTAGTCVKQRHRLQQQVEGVLVFGADVIVEVDNECAPPDNTAVGGGYNQEALSGVPFNTITHFSGKTFSGIAEATGTYVASIAADDAVQELANTFGTMTDKVGTPELMIFPSYERGDLLAYRSEVWVSADDDFQLYDVFMSATTKEVLSVCSKINKSREAPIMRLRRERDLQAGSTFDAPGSKGEMCGSCANQELITWSTNEVECPINTLYMDDANRSTTCLVGTNGEGTQVLGPGIVSALSYYGTYDCNQRESGCNANALPTECSDALSDVHFGVTEALKWFQDELGVMGGLNVDAGNPIKTASFVHFANSYCNAFFTTQTNSLYFGDCDCQFWTPLTSLDVAAHELAHGVTNYASGLVYAYQPGGLNEGYSDIVGATMEYVINDSEDTPDFTLGENLIGEGMDGFILRYMENPTQDGKSIGNVCDFTNELNVHYTSGVPNLAFTSSVRACQADGCGSERECVMLMGPLYMYANIQGLTQLSGYLDAAGATCRLTQEFMDRGETASRCSADEARQFVRDGWAAVGVSVADDCAATTTTGCVLPGIPSDAGGGGLVGCLKWVGGALRSTVGWLLSPFFG